MLINSLKEEIVLLRESLNETEKERHSLGEKLKNYLDSEGRAAFVNNNLLNSSSYIEIFDDKFTNVEQIRTEMREQKKVY